MSAVEGSAAIEQSGWRNSVNPGLPPQLSHRLRTKADVGLGDRHPKLTEMTDPDPSPFANCHVIVCYGGAGLFDKHLASTIHCVDDEIIGWLQRREQRKRGRAVLPHSNPGGD